MSRLFNILSEMTKTSFTAPGVVQNRATVTGGGYCKRGKLVIVQLKLTLNININANDYWTLFDGLPIPVSGVGLVCSGTGASAADSCLGLEAVVTMAGGINVQTTSKAVSSGKTLYVSGIYMTS